MSERSGTSATTLSSWIFRWHGGAGHKKEKMEFVKKLPKGSRLTEVEFPSKK